MCNAHIRFRIDTFRRCQLDFEVEVRAVIMAEKPSVAALEGREEIRIRRIYPDGNTADGDDHALSFDLCG